MNDLEVLRAGFAGLPEQRDSSRREGTGSTSPYSRDGAAPAPPKAGAAAGFPERLAQTESDLEQLRTQLQELKDEWARESVSDLKTKFEALREAVLRYSFACAEVEMRLALIRARADDTVESAEILRRSLEEQTAASDELRRLARTLHQNAPTG